MSVSKPDHVEIWPVPPVPFTDSLEVDLDALDELTDFYEESGVDGLFVLAFSGEGLDQTNRQRLAVCERVVERVAGRFGLVAGGNVGGDLTEQIEQIKQLAQAGPDAVVLFVSTLPRGDHLVDDLLEIARQTDGVPLGLYECPFPEHRLLSAEQVGELAASGRFVFMKETSRDREQYAAKLDAARGTPMAVYQANLRRLPGSIEDGAPGFCGIIANVFPELTVAFCNERQLSDSVRLALHDTLCQILDLMVGRHYPASMKYLLSLRGLRLGTRSLMAGGEAIDVEDRRRLQDAVEQLGLLEAPEDFLRRLASEAERGVGPRLRKGPSAGSEYPDHGHA